MTPDNLRNYLIVAAVESPGVIAGFYGLLHQETAIGGLFLLAAGLYIPISSILLHLGYLSTHRSPN